MVEDKDKEDEGEEVEMMMWRTVRMWISMRIKKDGVRV